MLNLVIPYLAAQLRRLPDRVRLVVYLGYALLALLVAAMPAVGVAHVGPVAVVDLGKGVVVLAPVFGFTATANVRRPALKARPRARKAAR